MADENDAVDSKLAELESRINQWGLDRNITAEGGATVLSQMSKMTEEFAEFLGHWDRLSDLPNLIQIEWTAAAAVDTDLIAELELEMVELKDKLNDDFGDVLVCIINAMRLAGTDMETCLTKAWDDIKDRKGRMEGGKFIKENS